VGLRGFADEVSTSGRIALDEEASVQVTPPFSGRVVSVSAKAGDRVAKGQVLLSAEASEVAQARGDLAAAEAALATAKAQGEVAIVNAARQQALFKINGAALKDVQQAQSDATAARDTLRADEAALALVQARLTVLQAGGASGAGGSGTDALAVVRAPIAGVVTQRQVGPGQDLIATSNGATTPIFTVSDLSKVWLTADVREEDAARLHVGAPVTVSVSGLPGRSFHAVIDYVAAALDPATRRLSVRATVANPDGALKPEMFADFAVDAGPATQALGVPSSSVIYEGDTARVWVAGPGRALGLRQIRAGRTQGGEVEVLSGLQPGERVVTSGSIFIDRAAKSD
jgi:cobalt-zinc-cadmium efflux system membrane fusion protein